MAARINREFKFYVYKFFLSDECVYVGKGSGSRFQCQKRRFKGYRGEIVAYFLEEDDALCYERSQIQELAPQLNKALMPVTPEPWRVMVMPESSKDMDSWLMALGTRQMAARTLLSRDWKTLKSYGVDPKQLLSKLDPWCEAFNGPRS